MKVLSRSAPRSILANQVPVNKLLLSLTLVALGLSGCASTGNISPQYVAPSTYQAYDCTNLSQELSRVDAYIQEAQRQQSAISATGVGIGVSAGRWGISPSISVGLGKSTNTQARDARLSQLFGQRDAIIQSARIKQCSFAQGLTVYGE